MQSAVGDSSRSGQLLLHDGYPAGSIESGKKHH
jgi:hypothetical protein